MRAGRGPRGLDFLGWSRVQGGRALGGAPRPPRRATLRSHRGRPTAPRPPSGQARLQGRLHRP